MSTNLSRSLLRLKKTIRENSFYYLICVSLSFVTIFGSGCDSNSKKQESLVNVDFFTDNLTESEHEWLLLATAAVSANTDNNFLLASQMYECWMYSHGGATRFTDLVRFERVLSQWAIVIYQDFYSQSESTRIRMSQRVYNYLNYLTSQVKKNNKIKLDLIRLKKALLERYPSVKDGEFIKESITLRPNPIASFDIKSLTLTDNAKSKLLFMWAQFSDKINKPGRADQILKNWSESIAKSVKDENPKLYLENLDSWRDLIYTQLLNNEKLPEEAYVQAISRLEYIKKQIGDKDSSGLIEIIDRQIDDAVKLQEQALQ